MKIERLDSYSSLSSTAAELVADEIKSKKQVNLGLPTGSTPLGFYQCLVEHQLNWSGVQTFNLDEYIIDASSPDSYHSYMEKHLFAHVNLERSNIHFPGINYEDVIDSRGGLDITVLGLGLNGHIAFNEPGSPKNSKTRMVFLDDLTREANAKHFAGSVTPRCAITMGIETILRSKKIILLVRGQEKLPILQKAITGKISDSVPASFLQTHENVRILYCN